MNLLNPIFFSIVFLHSEHLFNLFEQSNININNNNNKLIYCIFIIINFKLVLGHIISIITWTKFMLARDQCDGCNFFFTHWTLWIYNFRTFHLSLKREREREEER